MSPTVLDNKVRPLTGSPAEIEKEALARARALVPVLAARALAAEKQGFIPEETIADLKEAGLLRLATPVAYGGYAGIDFDLALSVASILGEGCLATAWCYSVWMVHNWMSAGYTEKHKAEYYANGPDVIAITVSSPKFTQVEVEDDGYTISGHWSFGSGSRYAEWAMVQAPELLAGLNLPRSDFEVLSTWTSPGLKATGSNEVTASRAHVPAWRMWTPMDDALSTGPIGYRTNGTISHRVTMWMMGYTIVAPVVGGGRGALEAFRSRYAGTEGPGRTGASEPLQIAFAESAAEIDVADLLWRTDLRDLLEQASKGIPFSLERRAEVRRNMAFAAKLVTRAVTRLFETTGAGALSETDPLQRFFRDIHAGGHHVTVPWESTMADYGSVMLEQEFAMEFQRDGIDPDLNEEMAAMRGNS